MDRDAQSLFDRIDSLLSNDLTLTLQDLARLTATDRHQIERAFKAVCGQTFRQTKNNMRFNKAKQLLEERPMQGAVKEIASNLGVTPNSLSRFIKSKAGCSARELLRHKW